MKNSKKDYLIIGHPRSGTGYAAALFRQNGIDIGHEVMGEHGTSNWQFSIKSTMECNCVHLPDKIGPQDVDFKHTIHLIRNPLNCLNSVMFTERGSEGFRGQYVNLYGNFIQRSILSISGWRKLINANYPDAKIIPLEELCAVMGFEQDVSIKNNRIHSYIDGKDISELVGCEITSILADEIRYYNELVGRTREKLQP